MDRLEVLAKRVKMSRTTVAQYLKWLSGEHPTSEKRYFKVVPDFNEDSLNLQTVDVFFDTPSFDSLSYVEKLCELHPYTKFRARCYGGSSEVFAQFRIPKGTFKLLNRFLREEKKKGGLHEFRILPTEDIPSLFTIPRLEYWNNDSFTWKFDWNEWIGKPAISGIEEYREPIESKLDTLAKEDIWILSYLPLGMRRKQRLVIEDLKSEGVTISSQDFSRRLRHLKENFIPRYYVHIDIDAFDLYSNVIITAECPKGFTANLRRRLLSNSLPFQSTLKTTDTFMYWYLRMPPSHLSQLLNYLHERVENLRVSMVDHEKSYVYGLWADAFDEEKKSWRTDQDFLLCRNPQQ